MQHDAVSYNLADVHQTMLMIQRRVENIDKNFAGKMLKRFNKYMIKYEHLYPCRDLMTLIPMYRTFLQLVVGDQSFRMEIEGRFPRRFAQM